MNHEECGGQSSVPAFLRLGRVSRPLRVFSPLMRAKKVDAGYVNRVIAAEELFSMGVDLEGGGPIATKCIHWVKQAAGQIGVDLMLCAREQHMELLEFGDVGAHTDGLIQLATHGLEEDEQDGGEPRRQTILHNYVNIQLRGCGVLEVGGHKHRIEPGDAYVFDQSLEHEWFQESVVRSRMVSLWMSHESVRARAGQGV